MKTDLTAPHFTDEEAARAHYEAIRWPDGPVCPHCGSIDNATKMAGKTTRPGLYKCKARECRKPFTATMGTIYERSHIPLHKWLLATHLMCASKKGISAHQLYRMLGFGSYKTAWFMAHRIREAMREGDLAPFGGGGGGVEVDETFMGFDDEKFAQAKGKGRGFYWKVKVLALVDRETGRSRAMVVDEVRARTLLPILQANIAKEARVLTDEARYYTKVGAHFAAHQTVNHSKDEWARGDIHVNTIEGYFSIFKRGMRGIYQHCGKQHLHRYLAEFDFRYSNRIARGVDDNARTTLALKGTVGRRLTYRPLAGQEASP
ncbi:MAG: IS1595 family transposase [Alphaproteobacteria bacterium]|nr:IS1595 family transposase [Alphaproteobacteria bacterium]